MDISTIANVATALTVITGALFGLLELRRVRREREERAAFEVVHAIMTPHWIHSIVAVQSLPPNADVSEIENNPRALEAAHSIGIILEALGYAVFSGIVPLEVTDQLVGGVVRIAWDRMHRYVEFERARSGSQKSWEWFQWLNDQLERHAKGDTNLQRGAYVAYRDWRPPRRMPN